jgi:hypothetical protein
MKAVTVLVLLAVGAILGFVASRHAGSRGSGYQAGSDLAGGNPAGGNPADRDLAASDLAGRVPLPRQMIQDPAELAAEFLYRSQLTDPDPRPMPGDGDDGWPDWPAR